MKPKEARTHLAQAQSAAALAGEAWDYWRRKLQPMPPALTPQKEDDFMGSKVDFEAFILKE